MAKRKGEVVLEQAQRKKERTPVSGEMPCSLLSDVCITEKEWTHKNENQLNISSVILYRTYREKTYIFNALEKQIEYFTEPRLTRIKVFSKWHDIPRKHSAYGDDGVSYKYSGTTVTAKQWHHAPILELIRSHIEQCTGIRYNFVLINRYADGRDKMGEHKDDEKELDMNVPIASLSVGQERDFVFRHQDVVRKRKGGNGVVDGLSIYKMVLKNGMLLLMRRPTNQFWYHSLPARSPNTCPGVRVNLTFRKII